MAMLSPEELEKRFLAWVSGISERLGVGVDSPLWQHGGGAPHERERHLKALHSVR